jgi:hypothetical protein
MKYFKSDLVLKIRILFSDRLLLTDIFGIEFRLSVRDIVPMLLKVYTDTKEKLYTYTLTWIRMLPMVQKKRT